MGGALVYPANKGASANISGRRKAKDVDPI